MSGVEDAPYPWRPCLGDKEPLKSLCGEDRRAPVSDGSVHGSVKSEPRENPCKECPCVMGWPPALHPSLLKLQQAQPREDTGVPRSPKGSVDLFRARPNVSSRGRELGEGFEITRREGSSRAFSPCRREDFSTARSPRSPRSRGQLGGRLTRGAGHQALGSALL